MLTTQEKGRDTSLSQYFTVKLTGQIKVDTSNFTCISHGFFKPVEITPKVTCVVGGSMVQQVIRLTSFTSFRLNILSFSLLYVVH